MGGFVLLLFSSLHTAAWKRGKRKDLNSGTPKENRTRWLRVRDEVERFHIKNKSQLASLIDALFSLPVEAEVN